MCGLSYFYKLGDKYVVFDYQHTLFFCIIERVPPLSCSLVMKGKILKCVSLRTFDAKYFQSNNVRDFILPQMPGHSCRARTQIILVNVVL